MECIRLNVGSRDTEIPGYTPVDRRLGSEAYPLAYADGSVEEIRASHVLEHFSHRDVAKVVKHWVDKLSPGGLLRIAVPDFKNLTQRYMAGQPLPLQQFVMGSHEDENDHHGTIFDIETLWEVMVNAGLERIRTWKSEIEDCASLPISINLMGYKPSRPAMSVPGMRAVLAAPRYGVVGHFQCYSRALGPPLNVPTRMLQGCFWWQHLSVALEEQLAADTKYILTLDYDTVFTGQDVLELYRLMEAYPQADAICSVQSKRGAEHALFNLVGEDGKPKTKAYRADFTNNLIRCATGHFGLTVLRADSLRGLPRPWMLPRPNVEGKWDNGQRDADMTFWDNWVANGKTLFLANKVIVGHIEEVVTWPDGEFKPVHQSIGDYFNKGIPMEVARCVNATE